MPRTHRGARVAVSGRRRPCGDGALDEGEACDDGNRDPGDGCGAACAVEPTCRWDLDCAAAGTACSARQGQRGFCVPAPGACATHLDCPGVDPVRCPDTEACLCDGVCLRRLPTCEPCSTHHACGEDDTFLNPGRCVEHPVYYDGMIRDERVCLRMSGPHGECPPKQVNGGGGYCEYATSSGACPYGWYCEEHADCGGRRACDVDTNRCFTGTCVVPWPWAGDGGGCGDEVVCAPRPDSFDPDFLTDCATAIFYGGLGHCSVPCAGDEECADLADPRGTAFVCRSIGGVNGCRPAGCLHDSECPAPAGTSGAYCDPATMACVEGPCRLGLDPGESCGTDVPYDDCAPGYACVPAASGEPLGTCAAR